MNDKSKRRKVVDAASSRPSFAEEKKDDAYDEKEQLSPAAKGDAKMIKLGLLSACFHLGAQSIIFFIFLACACASCLRKINDDYLYPQILLMRWEEAERDYEEVTYYHRYCDGDAFTAESVDELVIPFNATTDYASKHMLKHGVSVYPDLISKETASTLREFIDRENRLQEGWGVIQNENRYSWGIDMNMHPDLQKYWRELASNEGFVKAIESICGPDPAIIEFTAITSSYGAVDQHDHQDVVPPGSGTKFARSFIPSYSLFIPLQDTTYDMGATHVCPGSHLCSDGCESHCPDHNLAMSGDGVWPLGWGALVNQQTTHKGMGHFCNDCQDRVVLIATFAPRPQTFRKLETRMIGQGGSYSLKWNQWGHTFSDFVHADRRMMGIQKPLRSLGIIKGGGWTYVSMASMRMSNFEVGYYHEDFREMVKKGGLWFLPQSWQALDSKEYGEENPFYMFFSETLKMVQKRLQKLNIIVLGGYSVSLLLAKMFFSKQSSIMPKIKSLVAIYSFVLLLEWVALHHVEQTNWAKDIRSGKAYNVSIQVEEDPTEGTLPTLSDVLIASNYASDTLATYSKVLDFAHPGNYAWKDLVQEHSLGFTDLSPTLQIQLCQSMIKWKQQDGRFLKQNTIRDWAVVTDGDFLVDFCRRELTSFYNPHIEVLSNQLESLKDDTKFGRWRDMTIHEKIIPAYLRVWDEKFFPTIPLPSNNNNETRSIKTQVITNVLTYAQEVPSTRRLKESTSHPFLILSAPKEPYDGAWLAIGDIVEGSFGCNGIEWYRGTIVDVFPHKATFEIEYDDGDSDRMGQNCFRTFVPFKVGEEIEFKSASDIWHPGKIMREKEEEKYDIQDTTGKVFENVSSAAMRRSGGSTLEFNVGFEVLARFNGGGEWFAGKIVRENDDGTYEIQYDDGDYESDVSHKLIRLRK